MLERAKKKRVGLGDGEQRADTFHTLLEGAVRMGWRGIENAPSIGVVCGIHGIGAKYVHGSNVVQRYES